MPFVGSPGSNGPLLLNKDGKPYTDVDARLYFAQLDARAFANDPFKAQFEADKERWKQNAVQKAVPEGGRQKTLSAVLRQKQQLAADVSRSYAEHKRAGGTEDALFELGRYVAFRTGTIFVKGPLKSWGRLLDKLLDFSVKYGDDNTTVLDRGYAGDIGKVKDVVRLTLVGENQTKYGLARALVRSVISSSGTGMKIIKDVTRNPAQDPCGYSDTNIVVMLQNGQPGEIQVNNRAILYGKMSKKDFCEQLGVSAARYFILGRSYGVEGGLGHALYEISQKDTGDRGTDAKKLAKRYYGLLREFPTVNAMERKALVSELAAFKQVAENRSFFAHH